MFEQTFKNIDDVLWKEAGCSSELDYTEQSSWMLFLKYLDDLEQERIVAVLDELSASTRSLGNIYEQKRHHFAELKQSILHKAFTGELTADPKAANRALSEAGV